MSTQQPQWYAVRCVFNWGVSKDNPPRITYEERIILVLATSHREAIERAEKEAAEYAAANNFAHVDEFLDCYCTSSSETPGDLTEIFSLLRDWDLPDAEYVNEFFDTGWENRQEPIE